MNSIWTYFNPQNISISDAKHFKDFQNVEFLMDDIVLWANMEDVLQIFTYKVIKRFLNCGLIKIVVSLPKLKLSS